MRFQGNIYLMGFMGCGKTTVGKFLSRFTGRPFIDVDEVIVKETGLSISEIFGKKGESYFRELEKSMVTKITQQKGYVVALGGGAVVNHENWEKISTSGITVTLSYPPEIIAKRLEGKTSRPLMNNINRNERLFHISNLMKKREPFYKRADLTLHFNVEIAPQKVAGMIKAYLA